MQIRRFFLNPIIILTLAGFILAGCGRSPLPCFYTLSSMPDQFASGRTGPAAGAVVGVGPVRMADYLDQSQIVTRTGDHQMSKDQFHRWAGPLKNNLTYVLADNIGSMLPTQQVHLFPWRQAVPIDFQVTVDVVRFDGHLGDAAHLETRWTIFQGPDKKLVKTRRSDISEPVTGADYSDLVAAQSRALARLSQEIVQAIREAGRI
ncbi:MAG: membrane integrity-associated transporter subunit PqiC [Deltaproteobacteria bacterium]|nr:membrane integrity-associated transporter subunit PqiC [Deltaproteobacteria bacterium]